MEREIVEYNNNHNGYSAKKSGQGGEAIFDLIDKNGDVVGPMYESFFAGSDWTPVYGEFEVGEWVYWESKVGYGIFRFSERGNRGFESKEAYTIRLDSSSIIISADCWINEPIDITTKATKEQIERILFLAARHKGYKKGSVIRQILLDNNKTIWTDEAFYEERFDALYFKIAERPQNVTMVYQKGIWAEIVEEPKEEDWKTKRVFCFDDIDLLSQKSSQVVTINKERYFIVSCNLVWEEAKKRASENS